jgi:hypothetical protein
VNKWWDEFTFIKQAHRTKIQLKLFLHFEFWCDNSNFDKIMCTNKLCRNTKGENHSKTAEFFIFGYVCKWLLNRWNKMKIMFNRVNKQFRWQSLRWHIRVYIIVNAHDRNAPPNSLSWNISRLTWPQKPNQWKYLLKMII